MKFILYVSDFAISQISAQSLSLKKYSVLARTFFL